MGFQANHRRGLISSTNTYLAGVENCLEGDGVGFHRGKKEGHEEKAARTRLQRPGPKGQGNLETSRSVWAERKVSCIIAQ